MADQDPKNARNHQNDDQNDEMLDEVGADAVEDLEADEDAEAVRGGRRRRPIVWEEEGQPQIE